MQTDWQTNDEANIPLQQFLRKGLKIKKSKTKPREPNLMLVA